MSRNRKRNNDLLTLDCILIKEKWLKKRTCFSKGMFLIKIISISDFIASLKNWFSPILDFRPEFFANRFVPWYSAVALFIWFVEENFSLLCDSKENWKLSAPNLTVNRIFYIDVEFYNSLAKMASETSKIHISMKT